MPGTKDRIDAVLGTVQTVFTLLRDVFLVILFVVLLCFPAQLNSILTTAGISQLNGGIFTWQQQAQKAATQSTAAAQATSAASESLDGVKATLESIASQSKDPNIRKQATDAANQAAGSITSLESASSSLAHSVVTQQGLLQSTEAGTKSSQPASVSTGWVYVGKTDSAHQNWLKPPVPRIAAPSPAVTAGQVVTFTDSVFLRADKEASQTYNQAAILGAVRTGSTAAITEVAYSSARGGGDFLWIKVVVRGS
jgi:hypothetical protein